MTAEGWTQWWAPRKSAFAHPAGTYRYVTLSRYVIGASGPSEFNSPLAVLLDELIKPNHGRHRPSAIARTRPLDQRAAGAAGLRCDPVRLRGQPFPQPCARQYLGRCHADPESITTRGSGSSSPSRSVVLMAQRCYMGLGIYALYQRREFRWKAIEPIQLVLGIEHSSADRRACDRRAARPDAVRPREALSAGALSVLRRVTQSALDHDDPAHHRLGAWLHRHLFLGPPETVLHPRGAVFCCRQPCRNPDAGALGIYQGGRSVAADSDDGEWRTHNFTQRQVGTVAEADTLDRITGGLTISYIGLLGLVLLARGARGWRERRGGMIALSYGNGKTVRVPKGLSVLEASLRHNVPHASVCGRDARCSTCRIRIIGDHGTLPEPSQREAFVLARVGATDPAIRLACQLRPISDLSFFQLFIPHMLSANSACVLAGAESARSAISSAFSWTCAARRSSPRSGCRSTPSSSSTASLATVSLSRDREWRPAEPSSVGDGMLALFGLTSDPQFACRQALTRRWPPSRPMWTSSTKLLSHDLRQPIRFGIGVHGGEAGHHQRHRLPRPHRLPPPSATP